MIEKGGSKGSKNIIDQFTVTLSMVATGNITSYQGENNISVIYLAYQMHCVNLEGCPTCSPQG